MKIIAVTTYWIEEHYKCEHTFPVEYSSIEELKEFIRISYENYKKEKEQYEKDLQLWNSEVESKKKAECYYDLLEKLKMVEKEHNKNAGSTKRVDRTESWNLKQEALREEANNIRQKIKEFENSLPTPPKIIDSIKIGNWEIWLGSYSFSIENFKFYSVDEWFEKFKK